MRTILVTLVLALWSLDSFADYGKAYYFKATIHIQDTSITGYFHYPHDFLPDSVLEKFKSYNKYFEKRIKSDCNSNGIEVFSFLLKYRFTTTDSFTSYVLCKPAEKIRIKADEIKQIKYHDVIIYDSWDNVVHREFREEDLEWLKTSPISVISDTSAESHVYFILHQESTEELEKIINDLMSIGETNSSEREKLVSRLNEFKVIFIKMYRV